MADMEKVIKGLEHCRLMCDSSINPCQGCLYQGKHDCADTLKTDALALLKEQEAKERKWLQAIADNQIANAPKDSPMSLDEQLESEYKSGIYDGLQMAFEILTEGR